jgi:uncharacterized protein (TIGR03084 family)
MPVDMAALLADLQAESAALDAILAPLRPEQYLLPTPAAGWCVADQVSHLAFFDEAALLAAVDPGQFRVEAAEMIALGPGFPDEVAARYRTVPGPELRDWLLRARRALLDGFAAIEPSRRLPWYGPEMSAASSVTARLMETWAHGQDIADALGVSRLATARLRHIAHIGVSTIGFNFALHGLAAPGRPVRVELEAPGGELWTWGPAGADNIVRAPALDFCLVVTQRRHPADTALTATGPVAQQWISIAQAFAGAPGPGRPPAGTAAAPENAADTGRESAT